MTRSEDASSLDSQARALFAQGDFARAESLFRTAIAQAPGHALPYYNLGVTLAKLDRPEEAIACYRAAIERNPGFADAYTNFGFCLNELNLVAQARQAFAIARKIAPDQAVPVLNEGIAALALGDYATGWKDFAARWALPAYARSRRDFAQPVWQGEDLTDKTLLLYGEQGFGDTIQMARFIPQLAAQGARIIAEVPPALAPLLEGMEGHPQIIAKGAPLPDFDMFCAMMDIPQILDLRLGDILARTPYLFAEEKTAAAYREILPPIGKRRIGLSWAGRASHEKDHHRSLPLASFENLMAQSDSEWVSLQRLVPERDIGLLDSLVVSEKLLDWGRAFGDFAATAAAITALDLVITVDTAIAHLAGALGKEVWVLLPFYADWRWLMHRDDSPWYPTARLFRQIQRNDWTYVLDQVARALA